MTRTTQYNQYYRTSDGNLKESRLRPGEVAYTSVGRIAGPDVTLPTEIDDCVLWLDAGDVGETTNQWDDKSGEDNHFTAASAAAFPSIANNAAYFDGTDLLTGPDLSALTEGEILVLMKVDSEAGADSVKGWWNFGSVVSSDHYPWGGDGQIYCGWGSTVRKTCGNPTPALTDYNIINIWSASGDWNISLNETSLYSTATNTVGFTSVPIIGRSQSTTVYMQGHIKAIAMFSRKLTSTERTQMHAYMEALND